MPQAKASNQAKATSHPPPLVNPPRKHARIELPTADYQRLKDEADRFNISVSAYVRISVMERIERDEAARKRAC